MNIGYPDTKNKQGGNSPLFSKEDDKKPKIEAPNPQSGTTSFPTVESRESKVSPKDLGSMAVDVLTMAIPGGGAIRTGKLLNKAAKLVRGAKKVRKIKKRIPRVTVDSNLKKLTSKEQLNLHNKVNKGITQIKPTKNQSSLITKKKKKRTPHVTVDPKLKNLTSKEQLTLHNKVNKGIKQIKDKKKK